MLTKTDRKLLHQLHLILKNTLNPREKKFGAVKKWLGRTDISLANFLDRLSIDSADLLALSTATKENYTKKAIHVIEISICDLISQYNNSSNPTIKNHIKNLFEKFGNAIIAMDAFADEKPDEKFDSNTMPYTTKDGQYNATYYINYLKNRRQESLLTVERLAQKKQADEKKAEALIQTIQKIQKPALALQENLSGQEKKVREEIEALKTKKDKLAEQLDAVTAFNQQIERAIRPIDNPEYCLQHAEKFLRQLPVEFNKLQQAFSSDKTKLAALVKELPSQPTLFKSNLFKPILQTLIQSEQKAAPTRATQVIMPVFKKLTAPINYKPQPPQRPKAIHSSPIKTTKANGKPINKNNDSAFLINLPNTEFLKELQISANCKNNIPDGTTLKALEAWFKGIGKNYMLRVADKKLYIKIDNIEVEKTLAPCWDAKLIDVAAKRVIDKIERAMASQKNDVQPTVPEYRK